MLVGAGVALAAVPAPAAPACAAASDPAALLAAVNARRAQGADCGRHGRQGPGDALAWNAALQAVADDHARWLASRQELSHEGQGGRTLAERARGARYAYARVAENLALGQPEPAHALDDWAASDGHCLNLHDVRFVDAGFACAPTADARAVWVLVLGRPLSRR